MEEMMPYYTHIVHVFIIIIIILYNTVDRLARCGSSDGELVWEEEQRTVFGNMECSHVTWQHSRRGYPIDLGLPRRAMVRLRSSYFFGGGGGGGGGDIVANHVFSISVIFAVIISYFKLNCT